MTEPRKKVFVSYSHADLTKVLYLADCIERLGLEAWLDRDLRHGEYIFAAVAAAIKSADFYVYVISPTSVESYWVREELNTAKALEIKTKGRRPVIVPVLLEKVEEVPTILLGKLGVDLCRERSEWPEALGKVFGEREPREPRVQRGPRETHAPGEQLHCFAHDSEVRSVAFSPDGGRLATAAQGTFPQVWPLSGEERGAQRPARRPLRVPAAARSGRRGLLSVTFRPTGNAVASGGFDNTARVRDLTRKRELLRVPHRDWVRSVAFRPDGSMFASVGEDGTVRVSDVAAGSEELRIEIGEPLSAVDFSADGQHLLTACKAGRAQVWDLEASRELLTVAHDHGELWSAAYAPDARSIATAGADGSVRVWDLDGNVVTRIPHEHEMWAVAFSPDGRSLAMAGQHRSARTWDLANDCEQLHVAHDGVVWAVAFSPDGTRLATGGADRTARVWAV